ncbi:hypothetical protein ACU6T4_11250 [Avibacterium paragallinarum]|uniref:MFS transporter n=1 Tax=Avibacterium paragallinarum TaxID=728 RepID=UPI00021ACCE5|nr:MFS transporter [Avibacterium paragallinarum]AZI13305.1 MFS transporter [Avibacterium paragallinarum]QIR12769.1 MFS transporter [Avibacterium paragallinarum]QJE10724.1 MFS transporter [Avibacterium paragallinarum]QJE12917.1 MFS transporter [Avibacterium paragallinarum]QJE15120.1 MFS transporter [Avibacterium paragallinarum]
MFQVLFSGFGSIFSILFLFLLPKFVLIVMPLSCLMLLGIAASFTFSILAENRIIKWCAVFFNCVLIFCFFWFAFSGNQTLILIAKYIIGFFTLIGIITVFAFIIEKLNQRKKAKEKAQIENSENNKPLLLEPTEKTPSDLIVSSEQKEETPSNLIIPLTQTENSLDAPISLPPQKEKGNKKRKRSEQAENNLTPEEKHQRKTDDIKLRILECERRIAELKKQELEYKLKSLEALEKYREIKRKNNSSNKK